MTEKILPELERFIIEKIGRPKFALKKVTTLEKDLNIWGDDADEFVRDFAIEFQVDVSVLVPGKYFSSEGDPMLRLLKKSKNFDLTVGDLEEAIKSKKIT